MGRAFTGTYQGASMSEPSRRALLARGITTGIASALTLGGVRFAHAEDGERAETVTGTLPPGSPDYVYLTGVGGAGPREIHGRVPAAGPSVTPC